MRVHRPALLSLLVASALLHACGGGGGGSSSTAGSTGASGSTAPVADASAPSAGGSGSGTQTLSGKVIDGYIEGATVCLDINKNQACDSGERTAVTGAGGVYSLDITGLASGDVASAMLLVTIPTTAKDADDNGQTLAQAGKPATVMIAPVNLTAPSAQIVNPLTTLVAQRMLAAGVTDAVATDWVRSRLGLGPTAQLNVDFKTGVTDPVVAQLESLARSTFQSQARFTQLCLDDVATKGPLDQAAVDQCTFAGLQGIGANFVLAGYFIQSAESPVYRAIASAITSNLTNAGALRDSINRYFDPTNTMLGTDFAAGLNELRDTAISAACAADPNCASRGYYRIRSSTAISGSYAVNDYYAIQQQDFVLNAPSTDGFWELAGGQWATSPSQMQITLHADGDFRITGGAYGSSGVRMSASSLKLAGLVLNTAGLKRFSASQKFPDGSNGYLLAFQTTTPRYVLTGPALTGPNQQPFTNFADAYPSSDAPTWVNAYASRTGLWMTFGPAVIGTGTVTFRNPDVPNQVMADTGTYTVDIVNGRVVMTITTIPSSVLDALAVANPSAAMEYSLGIRPIFGRTEDGQLREGTYTPASVVPAQGLQLNRTALNALLQALSLCQVDASYGNTGCPAQ